MFEQLKNKRIFGAGLLCEVNTFAAHPITKENFKQCCYFPSGEYSDDKEYYYQPLLTMKNTIENAGGTFVQGLCAGAQPGGVVLQSVYEEFRDIILDDLSRQLPVDAVCLYLHGAMVSEKCDDCEGDLLTNIRAIVGPDIFIGVMMDPHTHLSNTMVEESNELTWIKEYPHIDYNERAIDLLTLTQATLCDGIQLQTSVADCNMIDMFPTTLEPMKSLLQQVNQLEADDPNILSISIVHGFPWGDVADMGTKVVVLTNNHQAYGQQVADQIAQQIRALKGKFMAKTYIIKEALEFCQSSTAQLPVTLADFSDNTGLGALGDSTFILEEVFNQGMTKVALSPLYDPIAVEQASKVGVGNALDISIGGAGGCSGSPLLLKNAEVLKIVPDLMVNFAGTTVHYGKAVALFSQGNYIVVTAERAQTFSTECFSKMGIDPMQMDVLIAKSSEHFRHSFNQLGGDILVVSTPGAGSLDFDKIPYKKAKFL